MGCEYGNYVNVGECRKRLLRTDASLAHAKQCTFEGPSLWFAQAIELQGAAPTLSVIRLRQVRQFKVNGESLCDMIGISKIEISDQLPRLMQHVTGGRIDARHACAMADQQF